MGVRLTQLQTTFASGELDPALRGQRDIDAYRHGCKKARNVQRRASGGFERRPGSLDLNTSYDCRLEPFEFSADQRYLLAFADASVRIYDMDGVLLQTIVACPWTTAKLGQLGTTQLGDVMVITHTTFWPVVLRRVSATGFTLTDLQFERSANDYFVYQPYYKFEVPEITLTPSAATGNITLTARNAAGAQYDFFQAGHVGLRFRIYDCEVQITSLVSAKQANATVLGTLEGKLDLDPFKTTKGSNVVEVLHLYHGLKTGETVTLSGANSCGGVPADEFNGAFAVTVLDEHRYTITLTTVSYNYTEDLDGNGTPETTAYTAPRLSEDGGGPSVKFSVGGVATRRWMEPSISAVRGYPGGCCFHEMRLWLVGTVSQPDAQFGSNSLQPFRFDSGKGYDADSVQVAGGAEDVSRIRHAVSNGDLQLYTPTTEMAFQVRDGEPITPNNARIKAFSNAGCNDAQPIVYDAATLFVQENGLTVFEWAWQASSNGYAATAISTLASHLVGKPKQISASAGTSSRAEQFAFFVNTGGQTGETPLEGTLSVFHSMRAENLAGWALWQFGGAKVGSVCCIGPHIFLNVQRDDDGAWRLWKLASDEIVSLDGSEIVTGPASRNWILPAEFWNRRLDIVTEYGWHGTFDIPADGAVTVPVAVDQLVIGYGFYIEVETLPPAFQLPSGERSGMIKKLVRSVIDFDNAYEPTVNGVPITTRRDDEAWDGPIRPVTGPYEMFHMGFERDPTLTLGQGAPLPWRVLSVLQEVAL